MPIIRSLGASVKKNIRQILLTDRRKLLRPKRKKIDMNKEIAEAKKKKEFYRGIVILSSAGYFLSLFIQPESETGKNIASLVSDFLAYSLTILVTFWLQRQIMIISVFLEFFYFNLKLLKNPILIRVDYFYTYNFYLIATGLLILSALILFVSLWTKVPIKYIRKEFKLKEYIIVVPVIVFTLLIQIIARLI